MVQSTQERSIRLKLLQAILLAAAFGWGISIYGVFCSWNSAVTQLQGLGAGDIPFDPMLNYWLRMAAGAFSGIGIFLFILALNPSRYRVAIPIAGLLLFAEGIILLAHGIKLGLEPIPFYVDATFCLATGIGIWLLRNEPQRSMKGEK